MVVQVTCMNDEDLIKNEGRVATRLYVGFSDVQKQKAP